MSDIYSGKKDRMFYLETSWLWTTSAEKNRWNNKIQVISKCLYVMETDESIAAMLNPPNTHTKIRKMKVVWESQY